MVLTLRGTGVNQMWKPRDEALPSFLHTSFEKFSSQNGCVFLSIIRVKITTAAIKSFTKRQTSQCPWCIYLDFGGLQFRFNKSSNSVLVHGLGWCGDGQPVECPSSWNKSGLTLVTPAPRGHYYTHSSKDTCSSVGWGFWLLGQSHKHPWAKSLCLIIRREIWAHTLC